MFHLNNVPFLCQNLCPYANSTLVSLCITVLIVHAICVCCYTICLISITKCCSVLNKNKIIFYTFNCYFEDIFINLKAMMLHSIFPLFIYVYNRRNTCSDTIKCNTIQLLKHCVTSSTGSNRCQFTNYARILSDYSLVQVTVPSCRILKVYELQ